MDEVKDKTLEGDVEKQGQSSQEPTVDIDNMTEEAIAGMDKKQLADLVGNVRKARATATQKYQEAAELKRQAETTKQYADDLYRRNIEEQRNLYEQLQQTYQAPKETTQPPSFDENPAAYAKFLEEKISQSDTKYKELTDKYQELDNALQVDKQARAFDAYMDKVVLKTNPDVKKAEISMWFDLHNGITPDEDTIMRAAKEIQTGKNAEKAGIIKEYIAEKEKQAQSASEPAGAPIGSLPPGKRFIDLDEREQEEIMKQRIKHLSGR